MSEQNKGEDEFVTPDPSTVREDVPGDAGDEGNEIRFSEEQALIQEQARGIRPERHDVPSGGPTLDEARGNLDISDPTGADAADDSSDDPMHGGAMQ
ncbi:hypothetical protein [Arthrobacter sp. ISL-30]|uniref:hypothetical protein n=1 Tax=Arthrobacter sp. ISL-30 TaxID=2819109 RepID=UPI001BE53BFF|nr:hypothetical protein [Arthrobacter sp. ISL-30]MBT2514279.1 hypothetical protein [Arthrobacter sp. ISL-30]